jgi:hypothetical protein
MADRKGRECGEVGRKSEHPGAMTANKAIQPTVLVRKLSQGVATGLICGLSDVFF